MRIYPVLKKTTIVSGGATNPVDAYALNVHLALADTNLLAVDATSIKLAVPDSNTAPTDATVLNFAGLGDLNPEPADAIGKFILAANDNNALPSDASIFALTALYAETNAGPIEAQRLTLSGLSDTSPAPADAAGQMTIIGLGDTSPAPTDVTPSASILGLGDINALPSETQRLTFSGLGDMSEAPTEARVSKAYFWLSGSTGTSNVVNPARANGPNDNSLTSQETAALGAATSQLTSDVGTNIANGTTFTTAIYRGWFGLATTVATSVAKVTMHSTSALFSDIVMDSLSAVNGNKDYRTAGNFTFDLVAAGVNTLAKLQSCQVLHTTSDAVAGATPASVTVDAARIELTGVL